MKCFFRMPALGWCAVLAVLSAQPGQAQIGIAAGLNFERLGDIEATDRTATWDKATGYHVGIFVDLGGGIVSVRPGVYLRDFGDVKLRDESNERTFDLNLIEVPLDIRVSATSAAVRPYLLVGPVLGLPRSSNVQLDESLRTVTVWGNAGLGLDIPVPGLRLSLSPELRFAVGVNRLIKSGNEIDIGATNFIADEVSRQSAVMLRLGLRF
jgi:hypothetical protein